MHGCRITATLDLPMVIDLIEIFELKEPYCMITMTDRSNLIVDRDYDEATTMDLKPMFPGPGPDPGPLTWFKPMKNLYRGAIGTLQKFFPSMNTGTEGNKKSAVHDKHIPSILFISLQLPTADYLHSMKTSEPKAQQERFTRRFDYNSSSCNPIRQPASCKNSSNTTIETDV
ncbi:coatomer subunit gamma-like [Dorcoceras hygrometricum]|uniref:Coatomer subunit gamma-like n=1 Tax=Dorcoceras hygrometricum TaxID=472368 RepID=A0A2Z7CK56_9LAMI|nr:coatomer subunit gamma-like [Dorcoceras hygrometricum]